MRAEKDFQSKYNSAQSQMHPMGVPAASAVSTPMPPKQKGGGKIDKEKLEKDKAAVMNIRKAHNAWDRQRRDWEAFIEKSSKQKKQ